MAATRARVATEAGHVQKRRVAAQARAAMVESRHVRRDRLLPTAVTAAGVPEVNGCVRLSRAPNARRRARWIRAFRVPRSSSLRAIPRRGIAANIPIRVTRRRAGINSPVNKTAAARRRPVRTAKRCRHRTVATRAVVSADNGRVQSALASTRRDAAAGSVIHAATPSIAPTKKGSTAAPPTRAPCANRDPKRARRFTRLSAAATGTRTVIRARQP